MKVWLPLIIFTIQSTPAQSMLDQGCEKLSVTKDVSISPMSSLITAKKKARTDIECIMGCKDLATCGAVFRSNSGDCYEISTPDIELADKKHGYATGNLIKLIATGDVSNCSGIQCSSAETCFKGCKSSELSSPYCAVDARASCQLGEQFVNGRFYWGASLRQLTNSGIVTTVTYPKTKDNTGVRVVMQITVKGRELAGGCGLWYVTFDGNRCTNPADIYHLDYSGDEGNQHRTVTIDRTCYGLPAGNSIINLEVETCEGMTNTVIRTGWKSSRNVLITEVLPQPANEEQACPYLPVSNYQQYTWNEELDVIFNTSAENRLVKAVTYTKLSSETSLKVSYSAVLSVKIAQSGDKACGRCFIAIDGAVCTPDADSIIYHGNVNDYTYLKFHAKVYTLEGICENVLAAGTYSIEIYMGQCMWEHTEPTNFVSGGFNVPSRIHIEEVRQQHRVDGVYTGPNTMFRSMTGYLTQYYYYDLSNDTNDGTILTVTYNKQFSDTALRLTSSGSHMIGSSGSKCSRWYFTIDDNECTNPGTIEGVYYTKFGPDFHGPMRVSGVCNGITTGYRMISYRIGGCQSALPDDIAITGGGSAFYLFIEELRLDEVKTCTTRSPITC